MKLLGHFETYAIKHVDQEDNKQGTDTPLLMMLLAILKAILQESDEDSSM